ncbi:hypothetical protein ZOSMA_23G01310 [Zostera marina]|uniref:VQ domain-containing protein n=1 Tax=Zostera marina TaxID=29655 RepID=A0A0K9PJP8_ZOSMR|nr:hypothetical protein ZOSMA_23G01310 [Zostera marina]
MEQNRPTSPSLTATPTTTEGTDANSTDTACTSSTTPVAPSKQPAISKTVRMLNKNSHKISKHHQHARNSNPRETQNATQPSLPKINGNPPAQPQPPVYNINKNDFRDVVQKLTGSPAHQVTSPSPSSSPPPSTTTTSTRLHKIRPPPLTHINPRPNNPTVTTGNTWMTTPDSPLPPLPTVSLVAESPITTYMRCLNEGSQAQQPLDAPIFTLPTSPLGFGGCVTSSPSPPRLPMPSPK